MKNTLALVVCLLVVSFAYGAKFSSSTPSSSASVTFDGGSITTTGITVNEGAVDSNRTITVPAVTAGRGPYFMDFGEHTFDSVQDPVWTWGYNTKWNGQVVQTGEPGLHMAIEGHYRAGGINHLETYMQYTYNDGANGIRAFHFMFNKATHRMTAANYVGNPFSINDDLGNSSMRVYPSLVYVDAMTGELNRLQFSSTIGAQLESNVTATAGNDKAFHFKTLNTLSTDNNGADDRILTLANGASDAYAFLAGGRMKIFGAANGGQPGIFVTVPNGNGIMIKTGGGSGDLVAIGALTSGTGTTYLGGASTSSTVELGTNATGFNAGELQLTSTAVTVKSGVALKVGTDPVPVKIAVPSTASSACVTGQVAFNASHFYACTATNTWVRAALATW